MALNRASLPACVVCVTLLSLFLLPLFPLPTPWLVIHFIFVNSDLCPLCLLVLFVPARCLSSVFLLTLPVPTFWLCELTVFVHSILHQTSWTLCSYCNSRILQNIQLNHISAMQVHIAIHASWSTFNLNPLIFIFSWISFCEKNEKWQIRNEHDLSRIACHGGSRLIFLKPRKGLLRISITLNNR